jgi:hypothetical protein
MPIQLREKTCKVEAYSDEDGARLICGNVDDCPLGHPGEIGLDCFGHGECVQLVGWSGEQMVSPPCTCGPSPSFQSWSGPVVSKSNEGQGIVPLNPPVITSQESLPAPVRRKKRIARYGEMIAVNEKEDENLFEVDEPKPPKGPEPKAEDDGDEGDEEQSFFEPLVEEFESQNGYSFGLTLLKDEDDEFFVEMQLDNVTVQLLVEDFMEMMASFAAALSGIGNAMKR